MGTTVLVVLMLSGLGSLLWAVIALAGRTTTSERAKEAEPAEPARRPAPRSLTMPAHPATASRPEQKPAEPEEPEKPDEVAKAQAILESMSEPKPEKPKARLLHGAPGRPAGPVTDPLAWLSVDKETVTLPEVEEGQRLERPPDKPADVPADEE